MTVTFKHSSSGRVHLIEQAVIEEKLGDFEEPYEVGTWRERRHLEGWNIEDDFNIASLWKAGEDEEDPDIWIVNTKEGLFRAASDEEEMACREYSEPLGNVSQYLSQSK